MPLLEGQPDQQIVLALSFFMQNVPGNTQYRYANIKFQLRIIYFTEIFNFKYRIQQHHLHFAESAFALYRSFRWD